MILLPLDAISEVLRHTDISTALHCESLSHNILPLIRRRIYYSVELDHKNFSPFLEQASHLLGFTKVLELDTGSRRFEKIPPSDVVRLFCAILDNGVLRSLDCCGTHITSQMRELAFQISGMSSLEWLGVDISIKESQIDDHAMSLLCSSKLRRLGLCRFDELQIPSPPSGPLPRLTDLELEDLDFNRGPNDLLQRWVASWTNLHSVRRFTMSAPQAYFPTFPLGNQLEVITLGLFTHLDSFISSLPRFQRLKHMDISMGEAAAMNQFLDGLPSPMVPFTITFHCFDSTVYRFIPVVKRLGGRIHDRHQFLLIIGLTNPDMEKYRTSIPVAELPLDTLRIEFMHYHTNRKFSSWNALESFLENEF
ncbi:hypothetical protein DL96DRAFT_519129 [Flagelloscypha sp. PMI_526]|nr:hypothetical protein DL96DRAFT_519129 [Flagelloscypha sp. PMI_526]